VTDLHQQPTAEQQELWRQAGWPDLQNELDLELVNEKKKEAKLQTSIRLADSLLMLGNHTGYKQFIEAVNDLKTFRSGELLGTRTDREASILIGRIAQCEDILNMMKNAAFNRQVLANGLKDVQDTISKLLQQIKPEQVKA